MRLLLGFAAILAATSVSGQKLSYAPEPRGGLIYSYGPIVIDLGVELSRDGIRTEPVKDCSDAISSCVTSQIVEFRVRRDCSDLAAAKPGSAVSGKLTLIKAVPVRSMTDDRLYLLYSPGQEYAVFAYEPSHGIIGIAYDQHRASDSHLVRQAETVTSEQGVADAFRGSYHPRTSFRPLLACKMKTG